MRPIVFAAAALVLVTGCKSPDSSAPPPPPAPAAVVQSIDAGGGVMKQAISVTANDKGFAPSSVELKKGMPATLTFTRTSDDTCAKEVVFPELKITKDLPLNTPVAIDLPTGDARSLVFQCGMGMFKGKIVVQ